MNGKTEKETTKKEQGIEEPKEPKKEPEAQPEAQPEVPPEGKPEEVAFVTLKQFAKTFAVSKTLVVKWIKAGKVKSLRTFQGYYLIPKSEVAKLVKEFEVQPAPEKHPYLKTKSEKAKEILKKKEKEKVEHGEEAAREAETASDII